MQAIGSGNWCHPKRVAPNRYRGSAAEPSGTATVKVSLHAQEFDRVPSAGVSKGRLDLCGGAERRAIRLPKERIWAMPRQSAQLVRFAQAKGNQQFASSTSSDRSPSGRASVRSCNQTVEVGTCGVCVHHGIKVPQVVMSCSTLKNARPLMPQLGAALNARAGLGQVIGVPP